MNHWTDALVKLNACNEAVEWAKTQPDLSTAWTKCKRGDWCLWLIGRTTKSEPWSEERKPIVRAAIDCAKTALKYANNDTITANLWCIDALERWCNGEADRDEVIAARDAAADADAAAYAAAYAAYAAYAYAAYAADTAAYAATYATAAASASATDRAKALSECAEIVRRHFPVAPSLGVES